MSSAPLKRILMYDPTSQSSLNSYYSKVVSAFEDTSYDSIYMIEYSNGYSNQKSTATVIAGKVVGDIVFTTNLGNPLDLYSGSNYSYAEGNHSSTFYFTDPFIACYLMHNYQPNQQNLKYVCPTLSDSTIQSSTTSNISKPCSVSLFSPSLRQDGIIETVAQSTQSSNLSDCEMKIRLRYYTDSSESIPAASEVSGLNFRKLEIKFDILDLEEWLVSQSY